MMYAYVSDLRIRKLSTRKGLENLKIITKPSNFTTLG